MAFYEANDKYSATLSSGYTEGQTTLSVNTVPDNTPTIVVVAKGTTRETVFTVTGTTANSLTGVAWLKGYEGNLDAQMPVTCLNNQEFINQYSAAVSTPETLLQLLYGVDGGSDDTYVVSLDVAPTAYTAGMMITFKANTVNTGACTLNVNSLGAKSIKVDTDADPEDGDIQADQVVLVIYDGTNFQLQTDVPSETPVYPRAFTWFLSGTQIVANEVGAKYIVPQAMTVTKIWWKTGAGTATLRIQKNTTDINASMSATTSVGSDDSITSAALTAGQVITLDITAISSGANISVTMECEQ